MLRTTVAMYRRRHRRLPPTLPHDETPFRSPTHHFLAPQLPVASIMMHMSGNAILTEVYDVIARTQTDGGLFDVSQCAVSVETLRRGAVSPYAQRETRRSVLAVLRSVAMITPSRFSSRSALVRMLMDLASSSSSDAIRFDALGVLLAAAASNNTPASLLSMRDIDCTVAILLNTREEAHLIVVVQLITHLSSVERVRRRMTGKHRIIHTLLTHDSIVSHLSTSRIMVHHIVTALVVLIRTRVDVSTFFDCTDNVVDTAVCTSVPRAPELMIDLVGALSDADSETTSARLSASSLQSLEAAVIAHAAVDQNATWMSRMFDIQSVQEHLLCRQSSSVILYIEAIASHAEEEEINTWLALRYVRHVSELCAALTMRTVSHSRLCRALERIFDALSSTAHYDSSCRYLIMGRIILAIVRVLRVATTINTRLFAKLQRVWVEHHNFAMNNSSEIHHVNASTCIDEIMSDLFADRVVVDQDAICLPFDVHGVDMPLMHLIDCVVPVVPPVNTHLFRVVQSFVECCVMRDLAPHVLRGLRPVVEAYLCNTTLGVATLEQIDRREVVTTDLEHATCPISMDLMSCPVVASDGRTYELKSILRVAWSTRSGMVTSPITREGLRLVLYFNRFALDAITSSEAEPTCVVRPKVLDAPPFARGFAAHPPPRKGDDRHLHFRYRRRRIMPSADAEAPRA